MSCIINQYLMRYRGIRTATCCLAWKFLWGSGLGFIECSFQKCSFCSGSVGLSWSFPLCCEVTVGYSKLITKIYEEYVRNIVQRDWNGCFGTILGKSKTASTRKAISISRKQAPQRHKTCGTAQTLSISSKRQPPQRCSLKLGGRQGVVKTWSPTNGNALERPSFFFVVFCCCLAGFLNHFPATFRT